ncbi:hypothetical protein Ocin01_09573 [Orchesella cincta]|uniref:Uncharacterized protein n=1 Tax=Orchesella cincta TaxID=48709 RepID=A0A1D2MVJ0_ORCCI|nr:hypothetical protein Ocin01_09573 [Orchesella cincta]
MKVQQRRGNRGYNSGGGRNRQQFVAAGPSTPRGNQRYRGGGGQAQNRRLSVQKRNRNPNRQLRRGGGQGLSRQQGTPNQRYFNNVAGRGGGGGKLKRNNNIGQRVRPQKLNISAHILAQRSLLASKNSKRAVMKLAKKRVQRAKLLVSKKKAVAGVAGGAGKIKNLMADSGRVALGRNGFVTVRNTKAKRMERALVQMKIARAQQARNRISPQQTQRTVNLPGSSGMRNRPRKPRNVMAAPSRAADWNTSIVRTMRNDLVDVMASGQLDPEIQQKIAFIQSRSKSDRAPVMPDFKAPVTTSRMKLSDRFRLLRDQ